MDNYRAVIKSVFESTSRGEIATTLTVLAVLFITLGLLVGVSATRITTSNTIYAASSCAFSFGNPTLNQLEGKLICTVPTSSGDIPTIGCSLAQNDQWAAGSTFIGGSGTNIQFELNMLKGTVPGAYDLVAYEFDQYCSHEDKSVKVAVSADAFIPTPTHVPTATLTPKLSPTPTPVPACISEGYGQCMSQALCLAGPANQDLGDLGCSSLKNNWTCCSVSGQPTRVLVPTSTPVPTLSTSPADTPAPTTTLPTEQQPARQSAVDNVSVSVGKTCTQELLIASNNRQSWVYRVGLNGIYEVVPILGTLKKQQVVDAVCEQL